MPNAIPLVQGKTGTVLDGIYRLVRVIGRGGMGSVYEGVQLRLNKRVAIKLMSPELSTDQLALKRFRREAEVTSRIGHPHLVNVMDFGTAPSGEPYMVMEYLEGEDLEHRIAREGRLSGPSTVQIIRQVASALSAAHEQGIVHRDLKPANIFLVAAAGVADYVKVLDFGISKVKSATTRLTKPNSALGTPFYMSPEQATGKGDQIDHRADQWALACIAFECLTGRPPFQADEATAILYQIVHVQTPPLGSFVSEVRPDVEGVLLRALAKKPEKRFATIREFACAFDSTLLGRPAELNITPGPEPQQVAAGPVGALPPRPATRRDGGSEPVAVGGGPNGQLANLAASSSPAPVEGEITHVISMWSRPRTLVAAFVLAAAIGLGAFAFVKTRRPDPPVQLTAPPAQVTPTVVVPLPPNPPPPKPIRTLLEPRDEPQPVARVSRTKGKKKPVGPRDVATVTDVKPPPASPAEPPAPLASPQSTPPSTKGGFRW